MVSFADLDPDTALLTGLFIAVLAVPSFISAIVDRRRPWVAGLLVCVAVALVALALARNPEGYSFDQIARLVFERLAWVRDGILS